MRAGLLTGPVHREETLSQGWMAVRRPDMIIYYLFRLSARMRACVRVCKGVCGWFWWRCCSLGLSASTSSVISWRRRQGRLLRWLSATRFPDAVSRRSQCSPCFQCQPRQTAVARPVFSCFHVMEPWPSHYRGSTDEGRLLGFHRLETVPKRCITSEDRPHGHAAMR